MTTAAQVKHAMIQPRFNDARATQDAALNANFGLVYKRTCYVSVPLPRAYYQQRPDVLWYVEAEEAYEPEYCVHKGRREEELGVVEERKSW